MAQSYGEVSGHNGTQERSAPLESIAEARLITNTFSAQYGHTSGGFVEYTTKSGTNNYHGGYTNILDNGLPPSARRNRSRAAARPPKPIRLHLGGPISIPKVL